MLIAIITTGSRGDTQPYIALGIELEKAGHKVRLAAFENYAIYVKSYGLDFFPVKGDVSVVASGDSARSAMQADNPLKVLLSFNRLKSFVLDLQADFFAACDGADAIVYHPGAPIGYFAARQRNIPAVLATPFPMTPTREYPALIFYNAPRLGKMFNLATHKFFEKIMWSASSAAVNQFWRQKFGKAPDNFACPFPHQNTRNYPTLISCSNYVFPLPGDWQEHVHTTGYWFLDDLGDWQPTEALQNFLYKGAPPVYIGFGSVGDPALADQTTRIAINALEISGQRGILATGWSGLSAEEDVPQGIFILESAPHSWLFPRMAAVIHHGGAGTTHAGLKAGVPAVVIPHSNDQFAWGRRISELGVGAQPIPRKNLTAEKLAHAINTVLTEEIKNAASDLGMKIQSENGAQIAAKIISGFF
jgi:sterol 3beta-glucosyltransferase